MARLFDSYVVVSWSAASKPATGADSIWVGALTPDARLKLSFKASNPPTRAKALEEIEELLNRCLKRGDRVFLGLDFPIGFPAGTSAALKLDGTPWQAVRAFLAKEMKDKPDNSNNRFALAARMNRLISEGPFPFWGCSKKDELTTLAMKKVREHGPGEIAEFRFTETAMAETRKFRPQPIWKIAYAGAVGGQTLTGLPALEKLRAKFPALRVWPFDLPIAPLTREGMADARIVAAEVSTHLAEIKQEATEIRDEARIRTVAEWAAELDQSGKLSSLFGGIYKLSDTQKDAAAAEEGWILGI
jgi:hypothetical protein